MYAQTHKIIRFLGIKIIDYVEHYTERDNIEFVKTSYENEFEVNINDEPYNPFALTEEFLEEKRKRGL